MGNRKKRTKATRQGVKQLKQIADNLGEIHRDIMVRMEEIPGAKYKADAEAMGSKIAKDIDVLKTYKVPVLEKQTLGRDQIYSDVRKAYAKHGIPGVKNYITQHNKKLLTAVIKFPHYYHEHDWKMYEQYKKNDEQKLRLCIKAIRSTLLYSRNTILKTKKVA